MMLWLISIAALLHLGYTLACAVAITRAVYRAGGDSPRTLRAANAVLYGTISVFIGAVAAVILIGLARTL